MTSIRLIAPIDPFFTRSGSGAIWGRIYFEMQGGQCFPNKEWTDLAAAFVGNWLRSLTMFAAGAIEEETIPFYDGPFGVEVSLSDPGVLKLDFAHKEVVKLSTNASLELLLRDAGSVAQELLVNCEQRGWTNADIEKLPMVMRRASELLAR